MADSTMPRDGGYLEWIGNYDPMTDPPSVTLKQDRAAHWLSCGAQPSEPVQRILDKHAAIPAAGPGPAPAGEPVGAASEGAAA